MSDADKAYAAAQKEIARTKAAGETGLELQHKEFNDLETLPPEIAELHDLQYLDLDDTEVADISPLASLTGLQYLYLRNTQVSDISHLASLSGLQDLYLDKTQVSDISHLASLSGLQFLSLNNTQVSDISHLASLSGLQILSLDNTQVSDISHLASLSGLRVLYLNNTQVSDISHLASLSGLQSLDFNNTQVSDISHLASLSGLQGLGLNNTQVADLRPVLGLEQLGEGDFGGLWFRNTPATNHDPELARIAEIEGDEERVAAAKAHLRTLKPWPEPLSDSIDTPARPPETPTPVRSQFRDGRLQLAASDPELDNEPLARARQGWAALLDYLADFQDQRPRIANSMPRLDKAFEGLERALGEDFDQLNPIQLGMQAERFLRLSASASDHLFDDDAEDVLAFSLQLSRYLPRFPSWAAYKADAAAADMALDAPTHSQFEKFNASLQSQPWVDSAVSDQLGAMIAANSALPDDTLIAKGTLDSFTNIANTIGERAVQEAEEAKTKGKLAAFRQSVRDERQKYLAKKTAQAQIAGLGATVGIAADMFLNNAGLLTSMATRFPDQLGFVLQVLRYLGWTV